MLSDFSEKDVQTMIISEKPNISAHENSNKSSSGITTNQHSGNFCEHLTTAMSQSQQSGAQSREKQSSEGQNSDKQSFSEKAMESLLFQRLGLNKEQVDKIKAAMEELESLLKEGKISEDEFKEQMEDLKEMLEEEYAKGRDRETQEVKSQLGLV